MRLLPAVPPRLVAVAVLAAAGAVASPGRAAAGCGDYVVIPDRPADHPAPAPAPCDGPGCSGHPAPPDVPPTAPVTAPTGSDQWAEDLARTAAGGRCPRGRRGTPADDGRPVHVPQPVYHPPRPD